MFNTLRVSPPGGGFYLPPDNNLHETLNWICLQLYKVGDWRETFHKIRGIYFCGASKHEISA